MIGTISQVSGTKVKVRYNSGGTAEVDSCVDCRQGAIVDIRDTLHTHITPTVTLPRAG